MKYVVVLSDSANDDALGQTGRHRVFNTFVQFSISIAEPNPLVDVDPGHDLKLSTPSEFSTESRR